MYKRQPKHIGTQLPAPPRPTHHRVLVSGRLVVLRLRDTLPVLLGRGVRRCEGGSKGERQAAAPSAGVGAGFARRTACLRPAGWPIGMLDLCELAANAGNLVAIQGLELGSKHRLMPTHLIMTGLAAHTL